MMDALEFAREKRRLCKKMDCCENCPLNESGCETGMDNKTDKHDAEIIERVEKWSKEHPIKTRQTEMLKLFPDTEVDEMGVVNICPRRFGDRYNCPAAMHTTVCNDCREKWWNEEIE